MKNLFSNTKKTLKLIYDLEKKNLIVILLLSLLVSVVPLLTTYLSQELLNSIVAHQVLNRVMVLLIAFVSFTVGSEIVGQISAIFEQKLQVNLVYKLNKIIMNACGDMKLKDFENSETYNQIERINGQIAFKPSQSLDMTINLMKTMITLIGSIIFLSMWSWKMALLLTLVPLTSIYYYIQIGKREFNIQYQRMEDERESWYLNYILTHDFSFKEVKFYDLKEYIINKFSRIKENFIKQDMDLLYQKSKLSILFEVGVQIIGAIVLFVAITAAYSGTILVGNVVSIIKVTSMIQSSSKGVMTSIYALYNNNLYMEKLFEFIEEFVQVENEEVLIPDNTEITDIHDIEFKKVSYHYPETQSLALKKVDLTLHAGERVAIVGPNGSGKSTLIKVLTKLYENSEGEILVDGVPLREIEETRYKQQLSVLFQDFVKYELPLQENIGFGDIQNISDTEIMKTCMRELNIDFLDEEDLNQQLGIWFENGRQLSGGQWQKVALARSFFKKASVYILDEPSSALDPISEKEVFDSFYEKTKGKIGIFISHRILAAQNADKIIVMDKGEIVDIGTHAHLMKNCRLYQEMERAESYEEYFAA